MNARRPYIRPMHGWWHRNPTFTRYLWREASALGVAAYAVILVIGLWRLSQGEAAWNDWREAMRSPLSVLGHAILLGMMILHARSWFEILPKTIPACRVGGRRVADASITRIGWVVAVVAAIAVVAGSVARLT